MAVLQYYYTSWVDPSPGGEAGFHTRGMSPGITPDDMRLLNDLISYAIPPRLDPRQIASHPVALRYKYLAPQKSVLLCSQSTGTDEQGRTGNFFAHALMLAPDVFTHMPPVFYWNNPFWRTSDNTPGTVIPALSDLNVEPSWDVDEVWPFLAQGQRREWFYKLMCALIHSHSSHRRIVLVDSPEHVALWVAAASIMLPSLYRPLLSFATYHNNPYRADYLMTGTRSDGDFQGSPTDFMSFFVVDTEAGKVSTVVDSTYARIAAECTDPRAYQERMLHLLSLCDRRFPPEGEINDRFDEMADYYLYTAEGRGHITPPVRLTATTILDGLGHSASITSATAEDRDDLGATSKIFAQLVEDQPDSETIRDYGRTLRLLQSADPRRVAAALPYNLQLMTRMITTNQPQNAAALKAELLQTYGGDTVNQGLNSPEYLDGFTGICAREPLTSITAAWRTFGESFRPSPASAAALSTVLRRLTVGSGAGGANGADSQNVIEILTNCTRRDAREWLANLAEIQRRNPAPDAAVNAYYYALVRDRDPVARDPYRMSLSTQADLPSYEIERDLEGADAERGLKILEAWGDFENAKGYSGNGLTIGGLDTLRKRTPAAEIPRLSRMILQRPQLLQHTGPAAEETFIHEALRGIRLAHASSSEQSLCQRYRTDPRLTAEEQIVITGVLAMSNGQLDPEDAKRLRKGFSNVSPEQYAEEVPDFIARFFASDVDSQSHAEMVLATYVWSHRDVFWQSYWDALFACIIDPKQAKTVVMLLGFWFDASLSALGNYPYVVQSFFLKLPQVFDAAQKERGYRDAAREIERVARGEKWYPLVSEMVVPERKGIFGRFGH